MPGRALWLAAALFLDLEVVDFCRVCGRVGALSSVRGCRFSFLVFFLVAVLVSVLVGGTRRPGLLAPREPSGLPKISSVANGQSK